MNAEIHFYSIKLQLKLRIAIQNSYPKDRGYGSNNDPIFKIVKVSILSNIAYKNMYNNQ